MIGKVKILDGAFGSYKQESWISSLEIYKNYIKAGVDDLQKELKHITVKYAKTPTDLLCKLSEQ